MNQGEEMVVLDQPWQIEMYRWAVLRQYCLVRAAGMQMKSRRTLKSINREFGWSARTFAEAAALMSEKIRVERMSRGLDGPPPIR